MHTVPNTTKAIYRPKQLLNEIKINNNAYQGPTSPPPYTTVEPRLTGCCAGGGAGSKHKASQRQYTQGHGDHKKTRGESHT